MASILLPEFHACNCNANISANGILTVMVPRVLEVLGLLVATASATAPVSFDDRSLILNGTRVLLLSGAVHYARVYLIVIPTP